MSIQEFLEYTWEDSCIKQLTFDKDCLKLSIRDWKDSIQVIEFNDVFELHLNNYYDEDISHINTYRDEQSNLSISFYSAWEEQEILQFKFELSSDSSLM